MNVCTYLCVYCVVRGTHPVSVYTHVLTVPSAPQQTTFNMLHVGRVSHVYTNTGASHQHWYIHQILNHVPR